MRSAAIAVHHARLELWRLDSWEGRLRLGARLPFDAVPGTALTEPIERMYVFARRPDGRIWLAGALDEPRFDGHWRGVNTTALFDATAWRDDLSLGDLLDHPGVPKLVDATIAAELARGGGSITATARVAAVIADIARVTASLVEVDPDDPLGQGPDAWESALGGHDPKRPVPPRLTESELGEVETRLGFALPPGYRAYLGAIGDGLPRRYGGIASIRSAAVDRTFVLDGSWRAPVDEDDDGHDHDMGNCHDLHRALPDGANPSDGCFKVGVDENHSTVWLVLHGPAAQAGTIWQDDSNVDFGGWEPTHKDFVVYYYELLHRKLDIAVPPDPVNVGELEAVEELQLYASAWYTPLLFQHADPVAYASSVSRRSRWSSDRPRPGTFASRPVPR